MFVVKYKLREMPKKSVKASLLLSNGIDGHQNSCLLTNKAHCSSHLWVLNGVLAKFHAHYFTNSSY